MLLCSVAKFGNCKKKGGGTMNISNYNTFESLVGIILILVPILGVGISIIQTIVNKIREPSSMRKVIEMVLVVIPPILFLVVLLFFLSEFVNQAITAYRYYY